MNKIHKLFSILFTHGIVFVFGAAYAVYKQEEKEKASMEKQKNAMAALDKLSKTIRDKAKEGVNPQTPFREDEKIGWDLPTPDENGNFPSSPRSVV